MIAKGKFSMGDTTNPDKWGNYPFDFEGIDETTKEYIEGRFRFKNEPKIYNQFHQQPDNPEDYCDREFTGRMMYTTFEYQGRTCYKIQAVQYLPIEDEELNANPFPSIQ